jgi:hypothetical protein
MNIGLFSTHILWPTHFETELEIMQNHIDAKDLITHYGCNKSLKHCELIFSESEYHQQKYKDIQESFCQRCVQERQWGMQLLTKKVSQKELLPKQNVKHQEIISDYYFESHDNFKELYIDNYDIGWALLSSLISLTQNPHVQLADYKLEVLTNYHESKAIYYRTIEQIKEEKFDRVYVFNGRLSYTRAIFRGAEKMGIDCYVVERGAIISKYAIYKNHLPHSIKNFKENVDLLWENSNDDKAKKAVSANFFESRRKGILGSWHSMTDLQKKDCMPSNWDSQKVNMCFFTSSDDEFACVDNTWKNPFFENQIDILPFFETMLKKEIFANHHLYVRMHPNSKRLGKSYIQKFTNYNSKNITVLDPESPISTYSLMDNSNIVFSVGSSTGYEAVYAEKYTIQLGKSLYYDLEGPINPKSIQEIEELILSPEKKEVPLDVYKLGYYLKSYGINYKFYHPFDYKSGEYRKINLVAESNMPLSFKNRVKFFLKKKLRAGL